MGDFFRPLRIKLGLATLLLACAFMAAWMRSFNTADIRTDGFQAIHRTFSVHSHSGLTEWFILAGDPTPACHWWFDSPIVNYHHLVEAERIHLRIRQAGEPVLQLMIPHWVIVFVLTLFSAWLLLCKQPAKSTSPTN